VALSLLSGSFSVSGVTDVTVRYHAATHRRTNAERVLMCLGQGIRDGFLPLGTGLVPFPSGGPVGGGRGVP
jgi:hypothetical protein